MTSTQKSFTSRPRTPACGSTACSRRSVAELSRTRLKALIEAGAVAIDGRTIRDPGHRVNSGAAIVVDVPPPEPAKPAAEADSAQRGLRGRRHHRHRQAARAWSCIRRPDTDRYAGQRADRPLRRQPFRHRRRAAARHRAPARQGHQRADGGGEERSGAPGAGGAIRRATAATATPFERGYLAFVWGAPERPARHRRPADRPAQNRPRPHGDARGGREAVTHWQVLERYGAPKAAGGAPEATPPSRSRACWLAGSKPAEPTKFGSIWPRSAIRCWAMTSTAPGFRTKAPCSGPGPSRPAGPWQTGPACPYTVDQAPDQR